MCRQSSCYSEKRVAQLAHRSQHALLFVPAGVEATRNLQFSWLWPIYRCAREQSLVPICNVFPAGSVSRFWGQTGSRSLCRSTRLPTPSGQGTAVYQRLFLFPMHSSFPSPPESEGLNVAGVRLNTGLQRGRFTPSFQRHLDSPSPRCCRCFCGCPYFAGRVSLSKSSLESTMPISTRRLAARAFAVSPLARGSDLPNPRVVIILGSIPLCTSPSPTACARRPDSFRL